MRFLRSKLTRRLVIAGLSLIVVIAGISVFDKNTRIIDRTTKLAGEVAGIALSGKFLNYAIPLILPANAQVASPYQNVSGDVAISGRVGIGIESPSKMLVIGNGATGSTFRLGGKTNTSWNYDFDTTQGDYLRILSERPGATPFVIGSLGNVGIGTVIPENKLHINGSNPYMILQNAGGKFGVGMASDTNEFVIWDYTASTRRLNIASNGTVGIGTGIIGPRKSGALIPNLRVARNSATGGPTMEVQNLGGGDSAIDFIDSSGNLRGNIAYYYQRSPSDPTRFVINQGGWAGEPTTLNTVLNEAGGNVGIGTVDPGEKLEVNGNVLLKTTSPELRLINSVGSGIGRIAQYYADGPAVFLTANLSLFNNSIWNRDNTTFGGAIVDISNYYPFRLRYAAPGANPATLANLMIVYPNGNVGVGTANPNQGKVEVKGGTVCVDTNSDDNATSCIASESDIRLKKNIAPIRGALEKLLSIRGVEFDWKLDDPEVTRSYPLINRFSSAPHSLGVVAQEVQKIFPEAIMQETVGDNNYLQVDYTRLVAPIIEAIREQQKQISSLFNIIDVVNKIGRFVQIETQKLIVNGVDILERLNTLSQENNALRAKNQELELRIQALENKVK